VQDFSDKDKNTSYVSEYLPFYRKFDDDAGRSVDKALWTFGKFFKSSYGEKLSIQPSSLDIENS